jgi:hypothetical protein
MSDDLWNAARHRVNIIDGVGAHCACVVALMPHFFTSPFPDRLMPDKGHYQAIVSPM